VLAKAGRKPSKGARNGDPLRFISREQLGWVVKLLVHFRRASLQANGLIKYCDALRLGQNICDHEASAAHSAAKRICFAARFLA